MTIKVTISTLWAFLFLLLPYSAQAQESQSMAADVAHFFGVSPERIYIECQPDSFQIREEQGQPVLKMCLNKADNKIRCEIAIHDLSVAPEKNHISYDINVADPMPRNRWESLMQMHAWPDAGEQWRCPYAALEIYKGKFRMYNRWDDNAISKVSGNNCTESGNSIQGRKVFSGVSIKPGTWQHVDLATRLSHKEDGEFQIEVDGKRSPLLKGPNSYNDQRKSFLKFGIYKPAGWDKGHMISCVKYRNVRIDTP